MGSNTDIHELKEAKSKAEAATLLAEEAMQGKQQFLSNMSHEIRTPMNAIIGFTNVLLKSKLDKTQEEYLTAIKVSGDALLVLINDILDLAKVDAGRMTFEQIPFNLATSLSAMLLLFDIKIKEKNLELVEQLDTAIPEIILGDPIRLRQIILNLVSNAVKFTEVGKITIGVALLKQDSEEVTLKFTVTDTGIGIHKNKLEHIFDDFGQAAYENSRLYGGTGLGLPIVRKLIEQQGGTIRVESELGKGSAFSFELSFAKTKQKIKHETERVSNKQAEIINLKILVAEDMPLNQLLIKIILADFGFEVEIADNGKIAIEKLQQNKYDLVLMDLQMPEMNGFEATTYVRNTMNSNIPIIALTADVTTIDADKARAVGMNDYISKPIDEQLLYSKIIDVLQKTE
nr:ATP-binding protein [Flavobacterium sp.]